MFEYEPYFIDKALEYLFALKQNVPQKEIEIKKIFNNMEVPEDLYIEQDKKHILSTINEFLLRLDEIEKYLVKIFEEVSKTNELFTLMLHNIWEKNGETDKTFIKNESLEVYASKLQDLKYLGEETIQINSFKVHTYKFYSKSLDLTFFVDKYYDSKIAIDSIIKSTFKVNPKLLKYVDQMLILDIPNPDDMYWTDTYGYNSSTLASAGVARNTSVSKDGKQVMGINIYKPFKDLFLINYEFWENGAKEEIDEYASSYFVKNIAHEAAHCYDFANGNFSDDKDGVKSLWSIAMEKDNNFATSYAETAYNTTGSNCEDFAESIAILQENGYENFSKRCPNRAALLKKLFPEYFKGDIK